MRGRLRWGFGVWGGFLCILFALSSFMHGSLGASAVLTAGALCLFASAFWLARD